MDETKFNQGSISERGFGAPGHQCSWVTKKIEICTFELKKNPKKKIREYIHIYYIFLQSFGEKYVVFWSIEKKLLA